MSFRSDIGKIANYFRPMGGGLVNPIGQNQVNDAKRLNRSVAPIQFPRVKQDVASWRQAVNECEYSYYPFRVKIQQLYNDTILNAQVAAVINRRKNLTLLKDWAVYDGENIDEAATAVLKKQWFNEIMGHCLDTKFFGYSLICLGDMVGDDFPNVESVRRWLISPDREYLGTYVYSNFGHEFNNPAARDENGLSYYDWSIWVTTPSDTGASPVGYGLLYKIGMYEIMMRNLMGWNADYLETYGQPYRIGKTSKMEGAEYDHMQTTLQQMGSNAYAIIGEDDSIDFKEVKSAGTGWKSYENLEQRCQKFISKVILGHADALDSVTGKLGAETAAEQALEDTQVADGKDMEYIINTNVIPKLQNLGVKIPVGRTFKFKNDNEVMELRTREDENNTKVAAYIWNMHQAGLDIDPTWIEERTGIPVTKTAVVDPVAPKAPGEKDDKESPLTPKQKAKIKNLYDGKRKS
jgi:hypothetical protein